MRKKKTLALSLNKETIHSLLLERVIGGAADKTNETGCTQHCPTDTCPPTGGGGGDRSRRITEHAGCSNLICC